jgi:hypothetical protein
MSTDPPTFPTTNVYAFIAAYESTISATHRSTIEQAFSSAVRSAHGPAFWAAIFKTIAAAN